MDRIILDHLEAVDAGDVDAWWRLNFDLMFDKNGRRDTGHELEADLTRLDGWARAEDGTRARIIRAGRRYLDHAPPEPDDWFGRSSMNRPASAGYRALHLLAKHRPAQLEALGADTWTPVDADYRRLPAPQRHRR